MIDVIILRNNNNYDILKPSLNIDFFSWLLEVIMKFDTYFCCDDIEEFQRLMNHDVTERVKVDRLLDLLFDNEEEKEPFRQRWESVKNNSTYKRFESGTPTYIREEYE